MRTKAIVIGIVAVVTTGSGVLGQTSSAPRTPAASSGWSVPRLADGRPDLIFGNNAETVTHGGRALEVLLSRADGGYVVAGGIPMMNNNIFGLAAADLNGDGLLDLMLAHSKENMGSTGALRNGVLWGQRRP